MGEENPHRKTLFTNWQGHPPVTPNNPDPPALEQDSETEEDPDHVETC